jgi:hypothetical protein
LEQAAATQYSQPLQPMVEAEVQRKAQLHQTIQTPGHQAAQAVAVLVEQAARVAQAIRLLHLHLRGTLVGLVLQAVDSQEAAAADQEQ